jgi:hypothetical protein
MTPEQAIIQFIDIIRGDLKHSHYDHTLQVKKFARQIMTGKGIDELITDLRRRESERQKQQRVRITHPLTKTAGNLVLKYYKKLRRTQGIKQFASWSETEKSEEKRKRLLTNQRHFYANQSLREFLFDTLEYSTFNDPNSFIVYERKDVLNAESEKEEVVTYPFYVSANQARWYQYKNGSLDALLVEHKKTEKTKQKKEVSEFFFYIAGHTLHFVEYTEEAPELTAFVNSQTVAYEQMEIKTKGNNSVKFSYFIHTTGTKEVPAFRLSAYLDLDTENQTGITPFYSVEELLKKLININSLEDLTTFLHAFPRRRELVQRCDYRDEETGQSCYEGKVGQNTCPACKGSEEKMLTSEQDSIRIKLPEKFDALDLPDLAKFAYTEPVDTSLLDYLQNKTDWIFNLVVYAIFTQEHVSMANIVTAAKTAMEVGLSHQNIYDQLQPYAELFSQGYELGQRIITQHNNTSEGFTNSYTFPEDFQFETERDLIQKFASAKAAGMPDFVLKHINKQMLTKQTNSHEQAAIVMTWEKWRPFQGIRDELIASILAARQPQDLQRLLYENFDTVQREVEHQTAGLFYLMPYEDQKKMIVEQLS